MNDHKFTKIMKKIIKKNYIKKNCGFSLPNIKIKFNSFFKHNIHTIYILYN